MIGLGGPVSVASALSAGPSRVWIVPSRVSITIG